MTVLKSQCERCRHDLETATERFACEYNCTYCKACASQILNYRCPNCQGELTLQTKSDG